MIEAKISGGVLRIETNSILPWFCNPLSHQQGTHQQLVRLTAVRRKQEVGIPLPKQAIVPQILVYYVGALVDSN